MTSRPTKVLVEGALCVALAAVLNVIKLWHMPMGGSVSLEMLPLVVYALRRGVGPGMVVGGVYGVVGLMMGPVVFNWAQFLLDYPLGYAMVGAAGALAPVYRARAGGRAGRVAIVAAVLLGGTMRLAMHWVSGVLFFAAYAPVGQPAWLYSLTYNGAYMVPSMVLCAVAAAAVLPALGKAVPVP
jgi:thiamine transporter